MKYVNMENFKIVEILNKDNYHAVFDHNDYIRKIDFKPPQPIFGIDDNLTELRFSLAPGLVFKMEY